VDYFLFIMVYVDDVGEGGDPTGGGSNGAPLQYLFVMALFQCFYVSAPPPLRTHLGNFFVGVFRSGLRV
jgi:hypothetical protein